MRKSKTLILAFAVAGVATGAAFAHKGATGIVKERMDGMIAMGKTVKELSSMMRGETEFDAQAVKTGAQLIGSHAGEAMTKLFPEGSLQKASAAKEEIWSDWQTFETMAGQLKIYAEGLEAAADNGFQPDGGNTGTTMGTDSSSIMMGTSKEAVASAEQLAQMPVDSVFKLVTQTCSACHTKFRIEKK